MISVSADSNEQGSSRMAAFGQVVMADPRFDWQGFSSLPVDLQFSYHPGWGEHSKPKVVFQEPVGHFNVELKECSDYIASVLGPTGHLYTQVLSMREAGYPGMVLVLGGDDDVQAAIKDSLVTRYRGSELGYQIASYSDRLINFESNCAALGVPVYRWKASPCKRLLSLADKILTGGNLMQYAPKPADGERELAAASMLFPGIGPKTLEPYLQEYTLRFIPRGAFAKNPEDFPGVGKKRAAQLDGMTCKFYGMVKA